MSHPDTKAEQGVRRREDIFGWDLAGSAGFGGMACKRKRSQPAQFLLCWTENAVSEQEGRGLSGEEGRGGTSRQSCCVMTSSASGSQVTTRCYIIQIPWTPFSGRHGGERSKEGQLPGGPTKFQVWVLWPWEIWGQSSVEGGGFFMKFFIVVLFLKKKKLGHFLLKGRSQLELLNNQELYNDWPPLDSNHHSCPGVPSPYCHMGLGSAGIWALLAILTPTMCREDQAGSQSSWILSPWGK